MINSFTHEYTAQRLAYTYTYTYIHIMSRMASEEDEFKQKVNEFTMQLAAFDEQREASVQQIGIQNWDRERQSMLVNERYRLLSIQHNAKLTPWHYLEEDTETRQRNQGMRQLIQTSESAIHAMCCANFKEICAKTYKPWPAKR